MSPPTPAALIPSITALRNSLDYGDSHLPRCAAFADDMRVFRKKFRTKNGVSGVDLHDWKSAEGQADLTEMTAAYLDTEGNGSVFWPDDPASPNFNKYQYSNIRDRQQIHKTVKELFYRLNIQQYRNHKYKQKINSNAKMPDERGCSVETAIDVDSIVYNPPPKPPGKRAVTADMSLVDEVLDQFVNELGTSRDQVTVNNSDVYDGPRSSSPQRSRMRQFESTQSVKEKRPLIPSGPSAKGQPSKRQKRQPKPPLTEIQEAINSVDGQSWRSTRPRKKPQRDGFCGLEGMNEAISPVLSPLQGQTPDHNVLPSIERTPTIAPEPVVTPGGIESHETANSEQQAAPAGTENGTAAVIDESKLDGVAMTLRPQLAALSPAAQQPLQLDPEPQTSPSRNHRPILNFIYLIVQTRVPRTITERWTPQGRFKDKTLDQLIRELPFAEEVSKGLIFTVESECMSMVEHIACDDEAGFGAMKRHITREVQGWINRWRREGGTGGLDIDILIERDGQGQGQGKWKGKGVEDEVEW